MVGMLETSFPSELARISGASLTSVIALLDRLEEDGIVVSAHQGRSRCVSINPRYKARKELLELLMKMGERTPEIQDLLAALRRRPRKKGKKLWPVNS